MTMPSLLDRFQGALGGAVLAQMMLRPPGLSPSAPSASEAASEAQSEPSPSQRAGPQSTVDELVAIAQSIAQMRPDATQERPADAPPSPFSQFLLTLPTALVQWGEESQETPGMGRPTSSEAESDRPPTSPRPPSSELLIVDSLSLTLHAALRSNLLPQRHVSYLRQHLHLAQTWPELDEALTQTEAVLQSGLGLTALLHALEISSDATMSDVTMSESRSGASVSGGEQASADSGQEPEGDRPLNYRPLNYRNLSYWNLHAFTVLLFCLLDTSDHYETAIARLWMALSQSWGDRPPPAAESFKIEVCASLGCLLGAIGGRHSLPVHDWRSPQWAGADVAILDELDQAATYLWQLWSGADPTRLRHEPSPQLVTSPPNLIRRFGN